MRIGVFFVGEINDDGFNASAVAGTRLARSNGVAELLVISGVPYDHALIRRRLDEVVPDCDGLIFVGGQGNEVTPAVAAQWPGKRFAIVQGHRTMANLASYDVRQEDSAFLAGVLAARLTRTGTVAHLSGHRVAPGLKGRAAFAAGVKYGNPSVCLLSAFCGSQDDADIAARWAEAELAAGADVLFTMLNAGRKGATRACRGAGARQIGNAMDWVRIDPEIFVASAIARIDLGVQRAIDDMAKGMTPGDVVSLGLVDGDFVSLSIGGGVPASVVADIAEAEQRLRNGSISVPVDFDGVEFMPEPVP